MGIKIWLDDWRPAPDGWVRAHNVEEVILHLLHQHIDQMSLDHDLDQPDTCPQCHMHCGFGDGVCDRGCSCHRDNGHMTGLQLVEWMVRHDRWPATRPEVHSHNLLNSLRMKKMIAEHFPSKAAQ